MIKKLVNILRLSETAEPDVKGAGFFIPFSIFGLMLIACLVVGLYGFVVGHEHIFNNTREVPWGLLISTYAFFAITSTGLCLLGAISHLFGGNSLAPLAKRMVWCSLITIISGFLVIGMEIENPWRMAVWNIASPNLTSNIWWMGTLYGTALAFIFVEFWLILTKRYTAALLLGIFGALAEIAANSCLGGVFATLASHPYWYGAQLPVYFLSCAFLSGAAATVFFTHCASILRAEPIPAPMFQGMQGAAKVMMLMILLVSVATFWKMISFFVGGTLEGSLAGRALYNGPLSTNFWIFEVAIGFVAPFILLAVTRLQSAVSMSFAALLVLVGMFVSRWDMVTAGQIVSPFYGYEGVPQYLNYIPSSAEWIIVAGGVGLTGAAFLLGERLFGKRFSEIDAH